jgi:hypothetical protein
MHKRIYLCISNALTHDGPAGKGADGFSAGEKKTRSMAGFI